jgi:CheY-like chemotaxis protein
MLAFLDWALPGLDGIEVCRNIRKRGIGERYVYDVLLTGESDPRQTWFSRWKREQTIIFSNLSTPRNCEHGSSLAREFWIFTVSSSRRRNCYALLQCTTS